MNEAIKWVQDRTQNGMFGVTDEISQSTPEGKPTEELD